MTHFNRRQVLMFGAVLAIYGCRTAKNRPGDYAAIFPVSRFDKNSTAEGVTSGLDLTGKTALITGCNAGIGYEMMRVLVLRGAHVYGLARSMDKAEAACAAANAPGIQGRATPFVCEHTDFSSVVACADLIQKLRTPIDMLICNAGVYYLPNLELVEGLEKQFVVNHFSHFILVNRLLNCVKAAHQGRIVVVGSDAYKRAPEAGIDFDNLSGQRYYDPRKMYSQTKLANGLFVRELARRLSDTRTTANVVHPGWVMTETMRRYIAGKNADQQSAKTPEQGAATPCYVATSPALKHVSGMYFEDCNIVAPDGHMQDDVLAGKLWAVSEELTRPYLSTPSKETRTKVASP